jgi:hypothetical protein
VEVGFQVELAALCFFHWSKGREGLPSTESRRAKSHLDPWGNWAQSTSELGE